MPGSIFKDYHLTDTAYANKHALNGSLRTASTSATDITGMTFAMSDETCCTFIYEVTMARRTAVTKAGNYHGKVTYRRTGGGAPTIVGAAVTDTDQETTGGDGVAFAVTSNTISVQATAADSDGRNWVGLGVQFLGAFSLMTYAALRFDRWTGRAPQRARSSARQIAS